MYYNARYYDPAIGQFISPDTIVPDPSNVLDYNRYMYVRGNPLRYSDPSGHYSDDEIQTHLQNTYGDDWQGYWDAWQADPNWMWVLGEAQDGYTLHTDLAGPVHFSHKDGSFQLSSGKLHDYQGQGANALTKGNGQMVGPDPFSGYNSTAGLLTSIFLNHVYYQPLYDYSGGVPLLSNWRKITFEYSGKQKIFTAGSDVPWIATAYAAARKKAPTFATRFLPGVGPVLATWDVTTTVNNTFELTADIASYQLIDVNWQPAPPILSNGQPAPVSAPRPPSSPNGGNNLVPPR